jgi:hypothetical protein
MFEIGDILLPLKNQRLLLYAFVRLVYCARLKLFLKSPSIPLFQRGRKKSSFFKGGGKNQAFSKGEQKIKLFKGGAKNQRLGLSTDG